MMKEKVGLEIALKLKNNQTIGVGTGSTVDAAIQAIAKRVQQENLQIKIVPTSYQTAIACAEIGLTVLSPVTDTLIDWGFDGADAVDKEGNAIKGKGAAMLEEKILAKKCKEYFIIVDESKLAEDIFTKSFVPVEVVPSAVHIVRASLVEKGASKVEMRQALPGKHGPVITERGNLILDATFRKFSAGFEAKLKSIVGVVETGLFEGFATNVIVAGQSGIQTF